MLRPLLPGADVATKARVTMDVINVERVSQAIRNRAGRGNWTKGDARVDNLQGRTRLFSNAR